jgi:uncharacterized OsmC-like protein
MSDEPDLTRYELTGTRHSPRRIEVSTGDAEFVVGADANPVEYFLGSIVGCLNSTGSMVARDMGLDIDGLEVSIDGAVDYATYKGEETDARAGLQSIEVTLAVEADADEETLQEWLAAIERRCPITDNVENESSLAVSVEQA